MHPDHRTTAARGFRFTILATACALVALCLAVGCGPSQRNTGTEKGTAPTSATTYDTLMASALREAAILGGNYYVLGVAPTGSMEPWINSRTILLMERTDGADVQAGQIVAYHHSDTLPNVLHRVVEANSRAVILGGNANARSDGWQLRSQIKGRVVGVYYAR